VRDLYELAPSVALLDLPVDQTHRHLPPEDFPPSATHYAPVSKVGRERIKVEIEPVTGKERETARGQALSERVDEQMRHMLCAGTELKHRKNFRAGIDDQPQPEDLFGAAQPGSQQWSNCRCGSWRLQK
jgi:hypothetical protein